MPDGVLPLADPTLALWDWRRRVAALYAAVRAEAADPEDGVAELWRADARRPVPRPRAEPAGTAISVWRSAALPMAPYDPSLRLVCGTFKPIGRAECVEVPAGADGPLRLRPFARTDGIGGSGWAAS